MKKIAIGVSAILLGVSMGASAGKIVGSESHADGTFKVIADEKATVTLDTPTVEKHLHEVKSHQLITELGVAPSVDSAVWVGFTEVDGRGWGVGTDAGTGAKINLEMKVSGGTVVDDATGLYTSKEVVKKGDSLRGRILVTGSGDHGLPKTPGVYKYGVDAGLWAE